MLDARKNKLDYSSGEDCIKILYKDLRGYAAEATKCKKNKSYH